MGDEDITGRIAAAVSRLDVLITRVEYLEKNYQEDQRELHKVLEQITSTDPDKPGIALRMDRVEQSSRRNSSLTAWILGGGGVSCVALFIILWRALAYLSKIEGQ